MDPTAEAALAGTTPVVAAARPAARMTLRELLQISVYWLAINALWGAVDIEILPYRIDQVVCGGLQGAACLGNEQPIFGGVTVSKEVALAIIALLGALVAIAVQPLVAAVSDYTVTRWGRRKPYIVIGTILDVVFLAALAASDTYLAILAFVLLLQFSSNFAQGPFQGYVPDLVPGDQVGRASGLMGLMIILGNFVGLGAAALAIAAGRWELGLLAVAVLELTTMTATVATVHEPDVTPPPRSGAPLSESIRGTARDILGHKDFLWLLGSRFAFLVGVSCVTRLAFYYMQDSIGLTVNQAAVAVAIAGGLILVFNGLSVVPSGTLSDRYGRKPLITVACAICFAGMIPLVFAPRDPAFEVVIAGLEIVYPLAGLAVILVGVGFGVFVAVDWALMTDIIPKRTTGRYMGISNVATAISSPVALLLGGLTIAFVHTALPFGAGPRGAFLLGAVFFLLSALLVRPVDPRRRELDEPSASESAARESPA